MGVALAFNAGSIEATLTLNRNPFTAGLAAAKAQADEFKRRNKIELPITAKLDRTSLDAVKAQIAKAAAKLTVKLSLDRESLKAVQAQIGRAVGRIAVKVSLDRDSLLKVKEQISKTVARVTVKLDVDSKALTELRAKLAAERFKVNVDVDYNRSALDNINKSFSQGADSAGRMETIIAAIIALAPVLASALIAAVGAVGALAGGFGIAAAGAGALAIVAVPAFKQIKAAAAGGAAEINKLPAGLKQAAIAYKGVTDEINALAKANERMVGIAFTSWFTAATTALKTLNPLIDASAKAFSTAGAMAQTFFGGQWWQQFVGWLAQQMVPTMITLMRIVLSAIKIIGNLTKAFWDLGGSQILEMIAAGLEKFAAYTERIGQNKTFQDFMAAAIRSLPPVAKLIGDLVVFILKLAVGLEPLGTLIIRVLGGIFNVLNSMPPATISAIAVAIGAVWAAIALGSGGPVALAVGVLASLATYFSNLYQTSSTFRAEIDALVGKLRATFLPIWDIIVSNFQTKILPAWDGLVDRVKNGLLPALQSFGDALAQQVLPKLGPIADTITGIVIPAIINFITACTNIVTFLINVFGPVIARIFGNAITVVDGALQVISGLLNIFSGIFTGNWTTLWNGVHEIVVGFWTIVAGLFGTSFDNLKATFLRWDADIRGAWNAALNWVRDRVKQGAAEIGAAWRAVGNFFREPINWVIRVVIDDGILRAWNAVMGWIGQPSLNAAPVPEIPAFAQGGRVRGPGTGTSDDVLARLSSGEYVVPEHITKKIWPFLEALRAGQAEALQAAGAFLGRNIQIPAYAGGGVVAGQQFAQSQHGPYVWGGVGPYGYDCSGFQSAIANVVLGEYPYRRRFATASFGPNSGAGGFVPGLNSAYGIGVTPDAGGGVGHTAGTLGGLNVESSGGVGPHTGPSARGATNGLFPWHFSLPQVGGQFVDGGGGGAPVSWWSIIANQVTSLFKGIFGGAIPGAGGIIGRAMTQIPGALIDKVIEGIKAKLEKLMTFAGNAINTTAQGFADNPLSGFGTADRGAIIPPGASTLFNATGKPEPLTNLDVYERMKPAGLSVEDVVTIVSAMQQQGSSGDTYNVMLPPRATVAELADQLDFKRRVVSKGRYSR